MQGGGHASPPVSKSLYYEFAINRHFSHTLLLIATGPDVRPVVIFIYTQIQI